LYDYFNEQFLQKIEEFERENMVYEKEALKNVTMIILKKCEQNNVEHVCKYLDKPELDFIDEIREN
jgi:hypothetical protein